MFHQVTRFTDTAPPPTKMIESHVWKNWNTWISSSIREKIQWIFKVINSCSVENRLEGRTEQRWPSPTSETNWNIWISGSIGVPWKESESYSNQDDRVTRLKELKHVNLEFSWSSMERKWKLPVWIRENFLMYLQRYQCIFHGRLYSTRVAYSLDSRRGVHIEFEFIQTLYILNLSKSCHVMYPNKLNVYILNLANSCKNCVIKLSWRWKIYSFKERNAKNEI